MELKVCLHLFRFICILFFLVIAVRLSDGHNSSSGRVEMYINGQWGTVCDDSWTTESSNCCMQTIGTRSYWHIQPLWHWIISLSHLS